MRGNVLNKSLCGRPHKLSDRDARAIVRKAKKNPKISAPKLADQIAIASGKKVHPETVRRILRSGETTDGVGAWKILKDHFEPVTRARVIQLLDEFFGTRYQPEEDVVIFISRVNTAATRLQEAGHKLDDLYIGFQLIRWLPQEFQFTVQQIYRWKEEDFRAIKIESELILEANRLQLMKQDLEKAENAYLSIFTSKKSKTFPGATAAAHGDPSGKKDYQKKDGKVFNCKTIKNVKQSIKTTGPCYVCNKYGHLKVNCKEKKLSTKSSFYCK
ncbi:retrovirus-related Pol polyprotein from transposon TNT 1-94 [Trichonephila inaurata madagascariensis]|uniref:Retrovirus-related Pol polyprotein from transposon TNT 1-94 n=1 Tax=Trichonephila inaurata madagascariensis TaxID=2747483 RepID=A0A8X6WQ74_9ARAC|nr:retrovirus-related Pol polyprotein from transposon TNT 1-94 [Trichonephila inaurata madagascariensis]